MHSAQTYQWSRKNLRYLASRSPARIRFERMGAARHSPEYRARFRNNGWDAWKCQGAERGHRWRPSAGLSRRIMKNQGF